MPLLSAVKPEYRGEGRRRGTEKREKRAIIYRGPECRASDINLKAVLGARGSFVKPHIMGSGSPVFEAQLFVCLFICLFVLGVMILT